MVLQNLSNLAAAILAGGLGTRLRSVVTDRPKVLAAVNGRPFLAYLLDQLVKAGIGSAVVCTGYMGDQIQAQLGDDYGPLRILYSHESSPLGTAGSLRLALPFFAADHVLVLNGDSYCDVALYDFWAWHRGKKAVGTILLAQVQDTGRFGRVYQDAGGCVLKFEEKNGKPVAGWINAGIYLLQPQIIESIPSQRSVSLEREIFATWIGKGLYGYQCHGRFLDIGTPDSFALAHNFFAAES